MAGGRPVKGTQQRYPELEELASWFHQALADAGYRSVHEFLRRGLFEKNTVYGVFGATRLLTLDATLGRVSRRCAGQRSTRGRPCGPTSTRRFPAQSG